MSLNNVSGQQDQVQRYARTLSQQEASIASLRDQQQDLVKRKYGVQSQPYPRPSELGGSLNLGLFSYPAYQVFVLGVSVVVCAAVWVVLSRTRVGMIVLWVRRAAGR